MPKEKNSALQKYKEYVRKRLSELTPIMQKASVGDFSKSIKVPKKEDEFTELYVGLSLMLEDLKALDVARKEAEKEMAKRLVELEKWQKVTTERELKMVELKKRIKELQKQL